METAPNNGPGRISGSTNKDQSMSNYQRFLTTCAQCGQSTSKAHARAHAGLCKYCVAGKDSPITLKDDATAGRERNNALLIDSGYSAFARERGDFDLPDNY
jgi:hypothetical protein